MIGDWGESQTPNTNDPNTYQYNLPDGTESTVLGVMEMSYSTVPELRKALFRPTTSSRLAQINSPIRIRQKCPPTGVFGVAQLHRQ